MNITIDEDIHSRMKQAQPPKRMSRVISDAIRVRLRPSAAQLDAAYRAAAREKWRGSEMRDWLVSEVEEWPE